MNLCLEASKRRLRSTSPRRSEGSEGSAGRTLSQILRQPAEDIRRRQEATLAREAGCAKVELAEEKGALERSLQVLMDRPCPPAWKMTQKEVQDRSRKAGSNEAAKVKEKRLQ